MKWKGFPNIKKEQIIVVFIIGLLLMVIALPEKKSKGTTDSAQSRTEGRTEDETVSGTTEDEEYGEYLERRLEECLSQMEGAGKVQVFVTLKSSTEKIVAKDRTSSKTLSGDEETETDSETGEETVYQDVEAGSVPYVVKEVSPAVKGVLVVAQGGDDPVVKQKISDAVMALFSIESHKITVVRMKEG